MKISLTKKPMKPMTTKPSAVCVVILLNSAGAHMTVMERFNPTHDFLSNLFAFWWSQNSDIKEFDDQGI